MSDPNGLAQSANQGLGIILARLVKNGNPFFTSRMRLDNHLLNHMKIDRKEAEARLLSSANEDYTGLYEAVWELNSAYPKASLGDKYDAAKDAICALLSKGFVSLYKVNVSEAMSLDKYILLEEPNIEHILENPVSWYPEYRGERLAFAATDKGERAYLMNKNDA